MLLYCLLTSKKRLPGLVLDFEDVFAKTVVLIVVSGKENVIGLAKTIIILSSPFEIG